MQRNSKSPQQNIPCGPSMAWDEMGVEPKIGVGPPNHPFVHRVFHYFHHPFWGFSPYCWKHPNMFPWNLLKKFDTSTPRLPWLWAVMETAQGRRFWDRSTKPMTSKRKTQIGMICRPPDGWNTDKFQKCLQNVLRKLSKDGQKSSENFIFCYKFDRERGHKATPKPAKQDTKTTKKDAVQARNSFKSILFCLRIFSM